MSIYPHLVIIRIPDDPHEGSDCNVRHLHRVRGFSKDEFDSG